MLFWILEFVFPVTQIKYVTQDALTTLVTHLALEEVYTTHAKALMRESINEEEKKVLFTLLPKTLSRFISDKSGFLGKALPTLATFLINVCTSFVIL